MGYKRKYLTVCLYVLLIAVVVSACRSEVAGVKVINIARYPEPSDFTKYRNITEFPKEKDENLEFDIRRGDLSSENLTGRLEDLLYACYDSKTKWPKSLPEGFDPEAIMEIYKNPGLNVRQLHEQGITGKGIGIAIVDQTLLVDHVEYKDRIKLYEENENSRKGEAQMHGPPVASIAVGKTVGVAPEADLYYIAGDLGTYENGNFKYDFSMLAKNIDRIIEINKDLPDDNKIRVISLAIGWEDGQKGYEEMIEALSRAKEAGIFVVSSSLKETYGYNFHGLGKEPRSDADNFQLYKPGSWWEDRAEVFFRITASDINQVLLVPMDFRCTAAPNGVNDYVVYPSGGWSWSIPYIAGVYALACQVNPDITYAEFWDIALKTGESVMIKGYADKEYSMEKIINPVAIIPNLK
ncbi:MAG TPA: peptidase S8 [Clostridiales bacterium]|nr:peptidase S8 [Clostridiales bacterium]